MEDTNKELERLSRELLAQEPDPLDDEELQALLAQESAPAFEDPMQIHQPSQPYIYRNYSNGYGTKPVEPEDPRKRRDDKAILGLMLTACVLCLGILGVLIYWMDAFIR